MKSIREIDPTGKKVLVRVDCNVPFDEAGRITDDTRIRGVLPTIRYLLERRAAIILCSHCGRPKGERLERYSLAPVAERLGELLGCEVALAPDCVGEQTREMAAALAPGAVLLLENLRFHKEETANDEGFSRELAAMADIYVNDAFAVSHRAHASVEGVTHHVDVAVAGLLLQKEIDFFNRAVADPVRPVAAVLGGAKVSSKLGAIRNMLDRVDIMVIGGAMANTFLKSQGVDVGASLVEEDLVSTAGEFVRLAAEKGVKMYLPVDGVAAERFEAGAASKVVTNLEVPPGWMLLDIGPATARLFATAIAGARTIVWNGPMGAFEMDPFARGSMAMVEAVTGSHALSVVGGGDTNVVINKAGAAAEVSYISTGGGAFLMLMEGKDLPGVVALEG